MLFVIQEDSLKDTGPAMDHSVSVKLAITSFRTSGHVSKTSHFIENGIKNIDAEVERDAGKSDKVNTMPQAPDLDTRDGPVKAADVAPQRRKCDDSPAIVPIKKRRIQLLEASRSPSSPPYLPSPRATSLESVPMQVVSSVSSSAKLLGFSSASSPRSSAPIPTSSVSQCSLPPTQINFVASGGDDSESAKQLKGIHADSLGPEQYAGTTDEYHEHDDDASQTLQSSSKDGITQYSDAFTDDANPDTKADGDSICSESSNFNKDDRLHWDLNTNMEAWDALTEREAGNISEGSCRGASSLPTLVTAQTTEDHKIMDDGELTGDQLDEVSECGEEAEIRQEIEHEESDVRQEIMEEEAAVEKQEIAYQDPDTKEGTLEDSGTVRPVSEIPETGEHKMDVLKNEDPAEELEDKEQNSSQSLEHRDIEEDEVASFHPEGRCDATVAPDHHESSYTSTHDAYYSGGNESHDLPENLYLQDNLPERPKAGKQTRVSSDDAEEWNYEPELEEHVDYGDSDCRDVDDPGMDVDDKGSFMQVESTWKEDESMHPHQVALSESDFAIAGEPSAEHSSERHMTSGRSRTSGWDQLPEGFDNVEEALRAAKEGTTHRGGRNGSWNCSAGRGSFHPSSRFGPGPGTGARGSSTTKDGFAASRGESYYADRHLEEPLYERESYRHSRRGDGNYNIRGREPTRRPTGFGRGRGGWMDSQNGHMNQWGPGRHRPGSGFSGPSNSGVSASRAENGGFTAPDVRLPKHGLGLGRGMRSTVSGRVGRGSHVRGPPVDTDGGVHYPLRTGSGADRVAGFGTGYTGGIHDRGGHGMIDRYRGGMDTSRSLSPRRPHPLDHSNMMGRIPGMRPDSRVVRSRIPPPNHHYGGPSEYHGPTIQRSSPSSRWSGDKREVDSFEERDFKRPLSRTRMPAQRTSPNVIHGSSLTDERNHQLISGSRHSPPLKSSVAPPYLRKTKEDNLDPRPPKRIEEIDQRHADSFAKDSDYRRPSPSRDSERERDRASVYRRERDRDDERRRDSRQSSSRDSRFPGGNKHMSTRDVDDDIAPRRRRPS
ncbi:hypothetical protein KP509_17G007300 [Ceratopteris richardii]|uniref:Uncharacterized protein n=1 Tax=Ceratopteris richardii TaxID=49495 RepID=A0A8T2STU4_CERRI|nr:hypothetical protein KP509_17G007300 [Ceratopteris richardii]